MKALYYSFHYFFYIGGSFLSLIISINKQEYLRSKTMIAYSRVNRSGAGRPAGSEKNIIFFRVDAN